MNAPAALVAPLGELNFNPMRKPVNETGPEAAMYPRPLKYVGRPKVSRAKIDRPTQASQPVEAPAKPTPTDLLGITDGVKAYPDPDLSDSQVRLRVTRGLLPSYRNPVPGAGRRSGRGRSIQRWISMSELAAFAASMKKKGAGSDPAGEGQLGSHSEAVPAPGGRRHGSR